MNDLERIGHAIPITLALMFGGFLLGGFASMFIGILFWDFSLADKVLEPCIRIGILALPSVFWAGGYGSSLIEEIETKPSTGSDAK